jgi:segregation and condensation protein A
MTFLVQLDSYRGPLDLLWYLIRREEIEVTGLSLARITQQYLDYLALLEQLDVNLAGEFIDVASQLIEMKSRLLLPRTEEVPEEQIVEEPTDQLVQRLLGYKKYRDVASQLDEQARQWQLMYPRLANDLPARSIQPHQQPIREVELWDLVSALGRVMRNAEGASDTNIVYDDVPIQTFIKIVHDKLSRQGTVAMTDILQSGMTKAAVIGLFLAVLELVRHHSVEAEQEEGSVEIWVRPGANFAMILDEASIDSYD